MAHTYAHLFSLSTTGLRFFTVYGPWGRPDMAYFSFTKAILECRQIDVYNHGNMRRDFTFIDDIVESVVRVLDRVPTGDGGPTTEDRGSQTKDETTPASDDEGPVDEGQRTKDQVTVISVEHLSKAYRLGQIGTGTLTEDLQVWWAKTRRKPNPLLKIGHKDHGNRDGETIWALKDVCLDVKQGEVLGIIGRNGAGKSTLLKIITGVTAPTSGQIKAKGRVASLLEVGTGFHPDLTGRENIYLNGAILGMKKAEIARKFDEIVAFSEVEQFIDTPVKRYSSGMYVRLAFAVAAHLDPEILLVDEVLAVGDAAFQKKCLGKMGDVARGGRTVLFVSHNMGAVKTLCSRAVIVEHGVLIAEGTAASVVGRYLTTGTDGSSHWKREDSVPRAVGLYFLEASITNSRGITTDTIDAVDSFMINLAMEAPEDINNAQIAIRFTNQEGIAVFTTANTDQDLAFGSIRGGRHRYVVEVPGSLLVPGLYTLIIASMIPREVRFDIIENELRVRVEDTWTHSTILRDGRLGVVAPRLEWRETWSERRHSR